MSTTKHWLLEALTTGTLKLLSGSHIEFVAHIEREDGSGKSFNVYAPVDGKIQSFYVRTVD